MKIYVVELNNVGYEKYEGFVVSANSREEAISFLKEEYGDSAKWGEGYTIKKIGWTEKEEVKIYLESFNAG